MDGNRNLTYDESWPEGGSAEVSFVRDKCLEGGEGGGGWRCQRMDDSSW